VTDRRLLLVRHGVTAWNREGRFQGHLDPELDPEGRTEAQLLAARFAGWDAEHRPTRILASSLARARETAEIIGAALDVPVEVDPRLIEVGQGEWEGRSHAELERDDPERYAAWRMVGEARPPGAEDLEQVAARVVAGVEGAMAGPDAIVCVVTHGGVLRVLATMLLALGARGFDLDADNASLSILRVEEGAWSLERWNDVHHLLGSMTTHVDERDGRPLAL
jgi:glucosyl-3-phosphoglycerate phosphatase